MPSLSRQASDWHAGKYLIHRIEQAFLNGLAKTDGPGENEKVIGLDTFPVGNDTEGGGDLSTGL
jgi:hypothetical protein